MGQATTTGAGLGTSQFPIQFDKSNLSAFGDLITTRLFPIIQMDWVYGINTQTGVPSTTGSGTVTTSNSKLKLSTGTTPNSTAKFRSVRSAKYRAGQGVLIRITCPMDLGVINNRRVLGALTDSDGVGVGYDGVDFSLLHRNSGSGTIVENWIHQANFNGDKLDGTGPSGMVINPAFGNVWVIKYPYLGYGDIEWFVQEPISGRFILVHTIRYANSTNITEFSNPTFYLWAENVNSGGGASDVALYSGSVGIFLTGEKLYLGPQNGTSRRTTVLANTDTAILSIKNCTTYNGVPNRSIIRLRSLSYTGDGGSGSGSNIGILTVRKGATLTGSPSFTPINGSTGDNGNTITSGNSIVSVDVAGTVANPTTTGNIVFNTSVARSASSGDVLLDGRDVFVYPGEIVTVVANQQLASDCAVTLNWEEDV